MASNKKQFEAHFPFGGLDASTTVQTQPPYTTPDCLNVRPIDVFNHRQRGGTRPGFGPAFYGQANGANPVRLLSSIPTSTVTGPNIWPEDFIGGSYLPLWQTLSAMDPVHVAPQIDAEFNMAYSSLLRPEGAYHAPLSNLDVTKRQEISMFICPYKGAWCGSHHLFMWLDNANPGAPIDPPPVTVPRGISAYVLMPDPATPLLPGSFVGRVVCYEGGGVGFAYDFAGDLGYVQAGWFRLGVNGANVYCDWHGDLAAGHCVNAAHGLTLPWVNGTTFAFAFNPTAANGRVQAKHFRHFYYPTTADTKTNTVLVESVNGSVYVENWPREFGGGAVPGGTAVSTSCNLNNDRLLTDAPYLQDIFIADWDETRIEGEDGAILIATPHLLDAASVADWTAHGISAANDVCVITNATGGIRNGTYDVLYVVAGNVHLHPPPGNGIADGTCSYKFVRSPKVLSLNPEATEPVWTLGTNMAIHQFRRSAVQRNLVFEVTAIAGTGTTGAAEPAWNTTVGGTTVDNAGANQVTWTTRSITLRKWMAATNKGAVPVSCPMICTYNGRITLAGSEVEGATQYFQSRAGDPYDFDYTVGDPGTAIYAGAADSYQIGSPITAIAPAGADYLLIGTDRDTWVQVGDLANGGQILNLSKVNGIQDKTAWCSGPGGEVYFLSNDGVRAYIPGSTITDSITVAPLPKELRNIDRRYFNVLMGYDVDAAGLMLYLSAPERRPVSHFFIHTPSKSIWRVDIDDTVYPTALYTHTTQDAAESCVIHGCTDGRLRRYRDLYEGDDELIYNAQLQQNVVIVGVLDDYVIIGPMMMAPGGEGEAVITRVTAVLDSSSGPITATLRTAPTAEGCLDANLFAGALPLPAGYRVSTLNFTTAGLNKPIDVRQRGAFAALILASGTSKRAWAVETIQIEAERGGARRI
jgi:hypothetical protein